LITKPDVTAHLWAELNGLQTAYPHPEGRVPPVGFPCPDFEMFLADGSTARLYEELRRSPFVVVDLSNAGALRGFESRHSGVVVIEAHPIRRPKALENVTALIVRPDTYVAWTSATTPTHDDIHDELSRILFTR
jgi:hypothetical protein